ncbi:MAG: hydrogenase accessory protein HypB [Planctomycetes bacterium SCN 63-9]|nr:MAG: hydrogenase accessory protein HypB [Planctomycetes bacterium SCN 63-9]
MCATCGCSDHSGARLTDLETGRTIAIDAAHEPRDAEPHHQQHHEHPGSDYHEHGHRHGPGHEHHHHHHHHDHAHHPDQHPAPSHRETISLEMQVLARNDRLAERNRGWFSGRNILALNLVSAPGSGKTTLLVRTIRDLGGDLPISVIEGDQETTHDAERIMATGCRVVQINTGACCHLDAVMVERGLKELNPPADSVVMIENVGNLVCPALFDLGESARVVILSVTEGEDKPIKYPHIFRNSDLMILNKIDLLPHVPFDVKTCLAYARQVNPSIRMIPVSAIHGDGLEEWYAWLRERMSPQKANTSPTAS